MANGEGAAKLIEKILSAANSDVSETRQKCEESIRTIRADGEKRLVKLQTEAKSQLQASVDGILERSRTNAELEARKKALEARRVVIDRAFDEAYAAICNLDDKARAEICCAMLINEAKNGETVVASKADQKELALLMPKVEAELIKAGKKPVKISMKTAPVAYGFVLEGSGYEIDCSFLSLMRDLRAAEETNIAKRLFD